jgi:hypothetical protein
MRPRYQLVRSAQPRAVLTGAVDEDEGVVHRDDVLGV